MLGIYFVIFCSLNEGEFFRTEHRWAALSTTGSHLVNCGKPRNTKQKNTFWCSGTQTVSVIICFKRCDVLKHGSQSEKQRKCSCTQEVKILTPSITPTHTPIVFTGTNTAQQPAQQQFPWLVTHTRRARAEVWSPDVKDCLGQCGPGMGQTHTDGQICKHTLTEADKRKYRQVTLSSKNETGCERSETFSCSRTPEIKCAELASPSTNLWTQNYTL